MLVQITQDQYALIEKYLPPVHGKATLDNVCVINALLYMAETGCHWPDLPKKYGNWHSIYMRMRKWYETGTLQRIFESLQMEGIIRVSIEPGDEEPINNRKKTAETRRFVWTPILTDRISDPQLKTEDRRTPKKVLNVFSRELDTDIPAAYEPEEDSGCDEDSNYDVGYYYDYFYD